MKSLEDGPEQFQLTDEGGIKNYLRVEIKDNADGSFELSQPYLIKKIIQLLGLPPETKGRSRPVTKLLVH